MIYAFFYSFEERKSEGAIAEEIFVFFFFSLSRGWLRAGKKYHVKGCTKTRLRGEIECITRLVRSAYDESCAMRIAVKRKNALGKKRRALAFFLTF